MKNPGAERLKNIPALLYNRYIMDRHRRHVLTLCVFLTAVLLAALIFMNNDQGLYHQTIARIQTIKETVSQSSDTSGRVDDVYTQNISAVILNGSQKGRKISLKNTATYSQAADTRYRTGDEVFVNIRKGPDGSIQSAVINGFKRDTYIAYIATVFVLLMIFLGGLRGLRSLASVVVNILIFSAVIKFYMMGINLIFAASCASVLFTVVSILLVGGVHRKSLAAIAGTLAGTVISMFIAVTVIFVSRQNGIHYEEMDVVTQTPVQVFMAQILIGTLGGIIDIAVSISSAIMELYDRNPLIGHEALLRSGREIGKDIMGTMANTLVFAYISGSIPMILLLMRNGISVFTIVNFNINLEIIRALTGSIGIVSSIPVTMYISVMLLGKKTAGEKRTL